MNSTKITNITYINDMIDDMIDDAIYGLFIVPVFFNAGRNDIYELFSFSDGIATLRHTSDNITIEVETKSIDDLRDRFAAQLDWREGKIIGKDASFGDVHDPY